MTPTISGNMPTKDYIEKIHKAAQSNDVNEFLRILAQVPDLRVLNDALTEEIWANLTEQAIQKKRDEEAERRRIKEEAEKRKNSARRLRAVNWFLIVMLFLVLLGGLAGWGKALDYILTPGPDAINAAEATANYWENLTATAQFPTLRAQVYQELTTSYIPPTPETPPAATPTPIPQESTFKVHGEDLSIVAPLPAVDLYRIPSLSAHVEPPTSDAGVWQMKAVEATNIFYTTVGNASVSWKMDQKLPEGVYAIFVLDSKEVSLGTQLFNVFSDGNPIPPIFGDLVVRYQKAGDQPGDQWQLIGYYQLSSPQAIEITTLVNQLGEGEYFNLSDILVLHVSEDQTSMINLLQGSRRILACVDDANATYGVISDNKPLKDLNEQKEWVIMADIPAWGGSLRTRTPQTSIISFVDWEFPGLYPAGTYEVRVWIPAQYAKAGVQYVLLADGEPLGDPRPLDQSAYFGEWVSLSTWQMDNERKLGLRMVLPANSTMGVAIDAVALLATEQ